MLCMLGLKRNNDIWTYMAVKKLTACESYQAIVQHIRSKLLLNQLHVAHGSAWTTGGRAIVSRQSCNYHNVQSYLGDFLVSVLKLVAWDQRTPLWTGTETSSAPSRASTRISVDFQKKEFLTFVMQALRLKTAVLGALRVQKTLRTSAFHASSIMRCSVPEAVD